MTLPPLECGSCRACCIGDTIPLVRGDDVSGYKTKLQDGRRVLAKRADGNCVYLGASGCKIHGRQPWVCRTLDCRKAWLGLERHPSEMALRMNPEHPSHAMFAEGRKRVLELRAQGLEI